MDILSDRYTLALCDGAFPLSTDSMVLADFVKLPKNARVLDLGSGCGTLGLLLCAKSEQCTVTGIELSEADHLTALENIRRNGLNDRLYSLCADLRVMPPQIPAGSFDCCVSNSPYFSGGASSRRTPIARQELECTPADLFTAASKALRWGGDLFLVHKPERLAQLCAEASAAGLEPKRLRLVRHRPEGPVALILLQCRRGGKPGLQWEELTLHNTDGSPTADFRRIYHMKENET